MDLEASERAGLRPAAIVAALETWHGGNSALGSGRERLHSPNSHCTTCSRGSLTLAEKVESPAKVARIL